MDILYLILGAVLSVVFTEFRRVLVPIFSPTSFNLRERAKNSMKKDMKKSKRLIFLGISNSNLKTYIDEIILEIKNENKRLPWKSIDIYFSNEKIGESWEHEHFNRNIVKVIFDLVSYFQNSVDKSCFPNLKEINFFENSLFISYGGSLFKFKHEKKRKKKQNEISVLYSVEHIKVPTADTKRSHTLRFSSHSRKERDTFNWIFGTYKLIERYRKNIFSYKFDDTNLWDLSSERWEDFIQKHTIYSRIVDDLVEFLKLDDSNNILELGCGIGNMSKQIASKMKKGSGSLTIVDYSVKMLEIARSQLAEFNKINYLLTDVKESNEPLYGFIKNIKFDKIICHFSFHHFINSEDEIGGFAQKWKKYLSYGGEIILSLHNSVLEDVEMPEEYRDWEDKLKPLLKEKLVSFVFTSKSFSYLQKENIPEDVLSALHVLENKKYPNENYFLKEIRNIIGDEETTIYKNLFLKHTKNYDIEFITSMLLNKQNIINAFQEEGYEYVLEQKEVYLRTYEDRIMMWRSPAILGQVIKNFSYENIYPRISKALDKAKNDLKNKKTAPSIVFFFKFRDKVGENLISTVNAIIINNKKQVLVVKRGKFFLLPGGRKRVNEGELKVLEREIEEETCLKVTQADFFNKYCFDKAFLEDSPLEMSVYLVETEGKPKPKNEIREILWLDKNNYSEDKSFPREWWDIIFDDLKSKGIEINI